MKYSINLHHTDDCLKYRLLYESGKEFIHKYLERLSEREGNEEFRRRKKISYVPAHAKSAILDIQNSIYQRMVDVKRVDNPKSYRAITDGSDGGIDRRGSSATLFFGTKVLPELLFMNKVGVFTDKKKPQFVGDRPKPYCYIYKREDILNEKYEDGVLTAVLLRAYIDEYDEIGMPKQKKSIQRLYRLVEEGVALYEFEKSSKELPEPEILPLSRIPFEIIEMKEALLKDIADYQIALLNLASADISYSLKSNYPFYTEQYNPGAELLSMQSLDDIEGDAHLSNEAPSEKVATAGVEGRKYGKGLDRPMFINPSSEPLEVSMKKQESLKREIREVLNLNIASIQSRRASAESKEADSVNKEEGLSRIGLELQFLERQVVEFWSEYEDEEPGTVIYPTNYSLQSRGERQEEANSLIEIGPKINSKTLQKVVAKEAARLIIGPKVSDEALERINKEIQVSNVTFINPEDLRADIESGVLDPETASMLRHYPKGTVEKAKKAHAERLALIAKAQGGMETATGVDSDEPRDAEQERSQENDVDTRKEDATRGRGKK